MSMRPVPVNRIEAYLLTASFSYALDKSEE